MTALLDLRADQCRFPFGEDKLYTFCGEHVPVSGAPYCPVHTKLCYRPVAPISKSRALFYSNRNRQVVFDNDWEMPEAA